MVVSLKYAVVERERRFLVEDIPDGVVIRRKIVDRSVEGTRLRLREVTDDDGTVTRKLGHKVRLAEGPEEVACTSMYLDDAEWRLLCQLPARVLRKVRHIIDRDGLTVAVDRFEDGSLLAEIDDGDLPPRDVPVWLDVRRDVTTDEQWTGATREARHLTAADHSRSVRRLRIGVRDGSRAFASRAARRGARTTSAGTTTPLSTRRRTPRAEQLTAGG